MSDRGRFWPAPPDWTTARIEGAGVTVTAEWGGAPLWLASGPAGAIAELAKGAEAVLPLAPDRVLLVTGKAGLKEGWQAPGLALSDLSDAYIRLDLTGPGVAQVLAMASPSLALNPRPRAAALGFAGAVVLFQPLPQGARLYVEQAQAAQIWLWLSKAIPNAKDHP